eukprot:GHVU01220650.1.p1 GENE.GHVU01220650.1~~GHVU01220650.1.p1  ORF type:complete len:184 (+),score=18.20 GHVU01220650.1:121-672(+)
MRLGISKLETKLSIATQVRDISSRHPEWSLPDRRRDTRGEREIIRPRGYTQSVKTWEDGRKGAEKVLVPSVSTQKADYWKAASGYGCSFHCPNGTPVSIGTPRHRSGLDEEEEDEDGYEEEEAVTYNYRSDSIRADRTDHEIRDSWVMVPSGPDSDPGCHGSWYPPDRTPIPAVLSSLNEELL